MDIYIYIYIYITDFDIDTKVHTNLRRFQSKSNNKRFAESKQKFRHLRFLDTNNFLKLWRQQFIVKRQKC